MIFFLSLSPKIWNTYASTILYVRENKHLQIRTHAASAAETKVKHINAGTHSTVRVRVYEIYLAPAAL